jgi:nitrate reductase molybdenum cofactor assembly chaperone NarJ/NarW
MTNVYELFSALLEYPGDNWQSCLGSARAVSVDSDFMARFIAGVEMLPVSDLQELYTRTFDLNPVCALEVGYHLFGENYKRGEFLANLRQTEAPFDLGQHQQLPDYLPVLLRLLTKLEDEDLRGSLISECLIPGLDKMLTSLKDNANPYRFLLEGVRTKLQSESPIVSMDAPQFKLRANLPVLPNTPRTNAPFETVQMPFELNANRDLF